MLWTFSVAPRERFRHPPTGFRRRCLRGDSFNGHYEALSRPTIAADAARRQLSDSPHHLTNFKGDDRGSALFGRSGPSTKLGWLGPTSAMDWSNLALRALRALLGIATKDNNLLLIHNNCDDCDEPTQQYGVYNTTNTYYTWRSNVAAQRMCEVVAAIPTG